MAAKKQQVATRGNTAMAFTDEVPDYIDPSKMRGNEDVTTNDITIPRIDVIQSLSPQRKKSDPQYIDGAEEGVLFNTATGELYGESVTIVPVLFRKEFVIWKNRDSGGGFRGAFSSMAEAQAALDELEDSAQCEIIDTAQHFCLIINEATGKLDEAVVSMSKSKMKCSRQLNTQVRMAGGDRFSRAYKLSSILSDGPKGEYYNLQTKPLGFVPEAVFRRGEEMYNSIRAGQKDVDRSTPAHAEDDDL